MTRLTQHPFGQMPDGTTVDLFTLTNARRDRSSRDHLWRVIVSLKTPDRHGAVDDIVLGFDDLPSYLTKSRFFGASSAAMATASRLAGSRWTATYLLAANNGPNHLHGGMKGWDKVVWSRAIHSERRRRRASH